MSTSRPRGRREPTHIRSKAATSHHSDLTNLDDHPKRCTKRSRDRYKTHHTAFAEAGRSISKNEIFIIVGLMNHAPCSVLRGCEIWGDCEHSTHYTDGVARTCSLALSSHWCSCCCASKSPSHRCCTVSTSSLSLS